MFRALIATIKDMGLCPCPRCLTPKGLFNCLGLVRDMKSRMNTLRVYAVANVIKAREFIFTLGNTVDGAKVEDALGEGSWVAILVRTVFLTRLRLTYTSACRIDLLTSLDHLALTHFVCWLSTSCTNANWVHGRRCLHT